jgi:hypothetical protein
MAEEFKTEDLLYPVIPTSEPPSANLLTGPDPINDGDYPDS